MDHFFEAFSRESCVATSSLDFRLNREGRAFINISRSSTNEPRVRVKTGNLPSSPASVGAGVGSGVGAGVGSGEGSMKNMIRAVVTQAGTSRKRRRVGDRVMINAWGERSAQTGTVQVTPTIASVHSGRECGALPNKVPRIVSNFLFGDIVSLPHLPRSYPLS